MDKCKCQNTMKILDINDENFILLKKREMICPMIYYFQCKECNHIYKYKKNNNIFERVKE